jgi:hypothetical protein
VIVLECDNCERSFEVEPQHAGGKVPCPHCGDVNRVPTDAPRDSAPAGEQAKRLASKGLPPDDGPEQDICAVHPAMARAHPFRFLAVGILLIGGGTLAISAATSDRVANGWAWPGMLAGLAGVVWWVGWYVSAHLWVKLEISNKRTIRKEGIIRRHTSEVLHDHVRNVEIRQSFLQRLLNVGYLGISSSGQDGIEIEVRDLPRPYELKSLIDDYRDM